MTTDSLALSGSVNLLSGFCDVDEEDILEEGSSFITVLLSIFSWSSFQRFRAIWEKIPKTQGGCFSHVHSFRVSGERWVHQLRRQWGGRPSGGAGTGRRANHFGGIGNAVGKGCWAVGVCMEVGLSLCTGEDAAEKVKSLLRPKGALEGAKRRGHVRDFTGSREEGWGVDPLQAGMQTPAYCLISYLALGSHVTTPVSQGKAGK